MKISVVFIVVIILTSISVYFFHKNRWYSETDVAKHANSASCWTSINGSIYDVTSLVNTHPGGSKPILQVCGKDGSSAFNSRHGDDSQIKSELENYKIGIMH